MEGEVSDSTQRIQHVTISSLCTGHIRCCCYLMCIGKRPTVECQYGAAKQDVAHIPLKCRGTRESSKQAQRGLRALNLSTWRLLSTPEGAEAAMLMWGEVQTDVIPI